VNDDEQSYLAAGDPISVTGAPEYYRLVFEFLHLDLKDTIKEALLTKPAQLRVQTLRGLVAPNVVLDGPVVWPAIKSALDKIEDEMKSVLKHRSVAFWLHLYRRIGVSLHPEHDDKVDPRTVGLVRQIAELAICKHGLAQTAAEFAVTTQINIKKVLGGLVLDAIRSGSDKPRSATRKIEQYFEKLPPQWVIRDFDSKDFISIYYVEGLSYQYWKVAALLRSLGKGARVEFTEDGSDWRYHTSLDFDELIVSIDERSNEAKLDSSLMGVWFNRTTSSDLSVDRPIVIAPIYNVERIVTNDIFESFGLRLNGELISNFLPATLDITPYLESHKDFSQALLQKNGFSLEAIIWTVWAFSRLALFPFEVATGFSPEAFRQLFMQNILNLCQRGYRIVRTSRGLLYLVTALVESIEPRVLVSQAEIDRSIGFLSLSPDVQESISLWSGGPRHLLIPFREDHLLVDASPLPSILRTLFFRVQHDQSSRGSLFEQEFRAALTQIGLPPESGELHAAEGDPRELDAGVRIGKKLILIECVSIERPLDYELGNPKTLENRKERLDSKIDQALSLAEFIRLNPSGRNYSFVDIEEIEVYVVSPFYEWIWDRSDRLWVGKNPRIMAASEAIAYLQSLLSAAAE
jgi:hypothetical protein